MTDRPQPVLSRESSAAKRGWQTEGLRTQAPNSLRPLGNRSGFRLPGIAGRTDAEPAGVRTYSRPVSPAPADVAHLQAEAMLPPARSSATLSCSATSSSRVERLARQPLSRRAMDFD